MKVAVLGGGPAAIAAAFELTAEDQNGRYEVTVIQPGWRLGGKCASGRNLEPDKGKRIEEHGLHVWFGFYENAFRVMREAYEELGRPAGHPLATLEDAFKGCNQLVLHDRQGQGWARLALTAPTNPLVPGQSGDLPHFWDIAKQVCGWAVGRLEELRREKPHAFEGLGPQARLSPGWFRNAAGAAAAGVGLSSAHGGENLLHAAHRLAHVGNAAGALAFPIPAGVVRLPLKAVAVLPGPSTPEHLLVSLLGKFRDWLWDSVVGEHVAEDPHLRLFFTLIDTVACAAKGIVEDRVLEKGWNAINEEDLCAWLAKHGASEVTVGSSPESRSPLLRAIYDVAFGYPEGVIANASVAAGTAMNDLLRLAFTYRGSLMYKMQAGMGDTVFTPFYQVLSSRGVKFKFFHTVTDLRLSADGSLVEEIVVVPQVELAGEAYDPLVTVNELECWPAEPRWDQLKEGEELKLRGIDFERETNPLKRQPETLLRGSHFDSVVLGIPVGALPDICGGIAEQHSAFAAMMSSAVTVQTQAFQLWLGKKPEELGAEDSELSVAGCYVEPLDTWCDMTHLVPREEWSQGDGVGGVAYFCGVLDERPGEDAAASTERVKQNAMEFLTRDLAPIWQGAVSSVGAIDWSVLADPGHERTGPARLSAQYWRANTTPSERYVLTPAGSVKSRLAADASGVDNLVLAGDWTLNGIDGGCVEAAVLSGLQAARALTEGSHTLVGESPTWLTDRKPGAGSRVRSSLPCRRESKPIGSSAGSLPRYVEFGGRATTPPPFSSTEGEFTGLVLKGDAALIEDLCKRMLNDPAGGVVEYRPLMGSHVVMLTGHFGRVASEAPGFANWGYVDEAQVSLWVPLVAGRTVGPVFVPQRVCMAVPFIVVNNAMSYAGGREIYGYPKTLGRFDPTSGVGDPQKVQIFGGNFTAESQAGWHTLLELARTRGAGAKPKGAKRSPRRGPWHDLEEIVSYFQSAAAEDWDVVPDLSLLGDVITALVKKDAQQVFLKQFRDVTLPARACYQAIVESPIHVTRTSWRPSLDEWQLTINEWDSHPIHREMGLSTQTTRLTFELKMDMIAEPGVVVAAGGS
jgi:uncharacterized protein with NAD-binding domain and iron-sulfur cluster